MPKKSKEEKKVEEEISDEKVFVIGDEPDAVSSELAIEEDSDDEELEDLES